MAPKAKAKANKTKGYIVKVKDNPDFVGIGAGGTQFAQGKAEITSDRMAAWFREHPGYEVTEIAVEDAADDEQPNADAE